MASLTLQGSLLVLLGGSLGGVARLVVAGTVTRRAGVAFPWGTLAVNVSGCLAVGALARRDPRLARKQPPDSRKTIGFNEHAVDWLSTSSLIENPHLFDWPTRIGHPDVTSLLSAVC
jgi:hypothetical protein